MKDEPGFALNAIAKYGDDNDPEEGARELVQVVVGPRSEFAGRTVADIDFHRTLGVVVVGLWRKQSYIVKELSNVRLEEGDVMVLDCPEQRSAMAKALVVDDEQNLRKVLAAMLKREGYDVAVAENGVQALAELKKNGADVVVTDQVMPQMGGLELLRAVLAEHADVPVIMITAHGTVDSAVEAIKLGAFDYITKPFEQEELKAVIAKYGSPANSKLEYEIKKNGQHIEIELK